MVDAGGKRAEKRPVRLTNKFVATLTGTEMWWDDDPKATGFGVRSYPGGGTKPTSATISKPMKRSNAIIQASQNARTKARFRPKRASGRSCWGPLSRNSTAGRGCRGRQQGKANS